MSFVIGVSGKINSGKTTIAKYIADELQCELVSFGNYVKKQNKILGLRETRENLQNVGQNLLENDINSFCKNVLHSTNWDGNSNLVIDGIRHTKVVEVIKKLIYPLNYYQLYVSTDDKIRWNRLRNIDVHKIDNHPTEKDVKQYLIESANLIISGDVSLDDNQEDIIKWLNSLS